jgi:hypothetical protein
MKSSLLNPHKKIEASIMRIYGFSRDADFGYTFTTTSGTFLGCREKKIFGNEYMGDGMKKQWFLRRFWGFNKFTWVYKKKSQKRELTST